MRFQPFLSSYLVNTILKFGKGNAKKDCKKDCKNLIMEKLEIFLGASSYNTGELSGPYVA